MIKIPKFILNVYNIFKNPKRLLSSKTRKRYGQQSVLTLVATAIYNSKKPICFIARNESFFVFFSASFFFLSLDFLLSHSD